MPKYSNGREAKVNDRVFYKNARGLVTLGKVTAVEKGDTIRVVPIEAAQPIECGECTHADDYNKGKEAVKPAAPQGGQAGGSPEANQQGGQQQQ